LGVKQLFYSALWFIVILMLASNFIAFNLLELFHTFFLTANPVLELSFKNCLTIVVDTTETCYNSLFDHTTALHEENIFAGFLYDIALSHQMYPSLDIFSVTGMGFFSTELTVSFIIACFCTVGIFFILLLLRPGILIISAYFYIGLLVIVSLVFIFCPSLFGMFIAFECLLLIAIGLLKLTSKSERIGEAISEMFMWTLFGSFFLLLGFFSLYAEFGNNMELYSNGVSFGTSPTSGIICLFFLIGFGVKIPT
jgi:formate hydrogenlyase subunit 3/multisubunit Na+/H+ antiporter MnhD subunit